MSYTNSSGMIKRLIIILAPLLFAGCHTFWVTKTFSPQKLTGEPLSKEKDDWTLVFEDDFSGKSLNTEKWQTLPYWGGRHNPGYHYNWFSEEAIRMTDSTVVLYCIRDTTVFDTATVPYGCGYISNFKSFTTVHGYFEARCKIPPGNAVWPAFWLVSHESWPPEIDIFEFYGSKGIKHLESNLHWMGEDVKESKVKGHRLPDPSEKFHVYGLEWTAEHIIWYFDGKVLRKQKRNLEPFSKLMHVVLNMGLMNNEDSATGNFDLPAELEIDYVRIYKKPGN